MREFYLAGAMSSRKIVLTRFPFFRSVALPTRRRRISPADGLRATYHHARVAVPRRLRRPMSIFDATFLAIPSSTLTLHERGRGNGLLVNRYWEKWRTANR